MIIYNGRRKINAKQFRVSPHKSLTGSGKTMVLIDIFGTRAGENAPLRLFGSKEVVAANLIQWAHEVMKC